MDNNNLIKLKPIEASPALPNLDKLCDMEAGRMSGKIFWDGEIYEQELEKIFARSRNLSAKNSDIYASTASLFVIRKRAIF